MSLSQPEVPPRGPLPNPAHDNGFGLLRLVLASLVIVSHVPELIDGNRSREILTQIFGSLSFGELAVDGFFLISGALITASWLNAASWRDYLWRRIIRIYPGFLVAFGLCLLVVAPLGAGLWPDPSQILAALRLKGPDSAEAFSGLPYPYLNGAMWSIRHEFNCYLMICALGLLGLLRWRWVILGLTVLAAVQAVRLYVPVQAWTSGVGTSVAQSSAEAPVLSWGRFLWLEVRGQFWPNWRLFMLFLAGANFYLWRDVIIWRGDLALGAFAGLIGVLFLPMPWAEIGFMLFGGYLIFYLARAAQGTLWARINARNDISYGIYLYAWPIQKLWMWYLPGLSVWTYGGLTFLGAVACGWASWLWIERPALRWGRNLGRARLSR